MFWRANKKRYGIIALINCKPHDVCAGRHIGWDDQFEIILPIKFVNIIFVKMDCGIMFWFVSPAKFGCIPVHPLHRASRAIVED